MGYRGVSIAVAQGAAGRTRGRLALALLVATLSLGAAAGLPSRAVAAANPDDTLTYEPYGLIHSIHSSAEVNGYLADLDTYGVGQALMQMPRFRPKTGIVKLPKHNRTMLTLWSKQAVTYNAAHATNISITAVFNGEVKTKKKGLDLEDPATRANMIASIESVLPTGVLGVHLDLEPYPVSAGFISLLEEIDAMFARVGFHGRLSVVAPANTSKWTPSHLKRVSELVAQVNPLYYDSEYETATAYESWMVNSLAYYSANVSPATRIVPVIPSYGENPWHFPNVENIETSTSALSDALAAGSRVNGAGIWWWWGFFYNEEGEGSYEGAADRAEWQSTTVNLPFSP